MSAMPTGVRTANPAQDLHSAFAERSLPGGKRAEFMCASAHSTKEASGGDRNGSRLQLGDPCCERSEQLRERQIQRATDREEQF